LHSGPELHFHEIVEKFTPKHMESLASEAKSKIVADRKEEPEEDSIDRGVIDFLSDSAV